MQWFLLLKSTGSLGRTGLVALQHVKSSQTSDGTRVRRIGRWILNHWTTREVQLASFVELNVYEIHLPCYMYWQFFFKLLSSIPLHRYDVNLLSNSPVQWHLGCFQFGAIMNKGTMNFM